MSSLVHHNESKYIRLLDGSGSVISSTSGALNVNIGTSDVVSSVHDNFNVNANLQVSDSDLALGQAVMAVSLPVVISSDQSSITVDATALDVRALTNTDVVTSEVSVVPVVGSHANASNFQVTSGPDNVSTNSIDCQYVSKIVAFGSVDQACVIKLMASQDDLNYYETGISYITSGAEDWYLSLSDGAARYYRLSYSASGTTVYAATIAGKQ